MKKTLEPETSVMIIKELEEAVTKFSESIPYRLDEKIEKTINSSEYKEELSKIQNFFGKDFEKAKELIKQGIAKQILLKALRESIMQYCAENKNEKEVKIEISEELLCSRLNEGIVYLNLLYVVDTIDGAHKVREFFDSENDS